MMSSLQNLTRREALLRRIKEIDREIEDLQNATVGDFVHKWDNELYVKDLEKEWIDLDDQLRAPGGYG